MALNLGVGNRIGKNNYRALRRVQNPDEVIADFDNEDFDSEDWDTVDSETD